MLPTVGFGLLLLLATILTGYALGGLDATLMFGVLAWCWLGREASAGRGRAAAMCAGGMTSLGLAMGFEKVAKQLVIDQQGETASLVSGAGIGLVVLGLGLCMAACRRLALGKGRSGRWGVVGLANILGFTLVMALPSAVPDEGGSAPVV